MSIILVLASCNSGTNVEVVYSGDSRFTSVTATRICSANKAVFREAIKNAWFQAPGMTTPYSVGYTQFCNMLHSEGKVLNLLSSTQTTASGRLTNGLWVILVVGDEPGTCNAKVVEILANNKVQRIDLRR